MFAVYLVLLRFAYLLFYRFWNTPLADIPGPRFAAATGLWVMYKEFTRQRRKWIHDLHLRYGPVVRIGPEEVSFATWDSLKEIYVSGGSGYDKTSFYRLFDNFDTQCMFSTLEKTSHGETKKKFSDRYNKMFIMQPHIAEGIREHAEEFIMKCTEKPGAAVDIYVYLHCYALDCITHHVFDPHGLHSLTSPSDVVAMKELSYYDALKTSYFNYYFPELYFVVTRVLKLFSISFYDRSSGVITSYIKKMVGRTDVSSYTVLEKLQEQKEPLPNVYIASECMDHTVAGIDTTGDALCFLLYQLSLPSSSAIQEKLHAELSQSSSEPVDNLVYLDAVVKEGLRCFTPIPMSLPRLVPKGGTTIEGFRLPENTIVSCQAYTLHRLDTKVFPNPEEFRPERWLDAEGAIDRNQLFFAFAAGGRGCIGKHLALLEMKVLLKEVYSTYWTRVAPEMTGSMEMNDQIMSTRPKDQICLLTFENSGCNCCK
ncbi:cytochrome P450 [Sparassis latifolia]|uniref:Cytochrome P450 n=1 Tax=Sparassis crispa TaxID=139825 RepID=A0A401GTA2_9APHY|nr:cytochrome P450 [Sparassis crispa]GBE85445.1 cytochrome P450 [Sparassis crispa]